CFAPLQDLPYAERALAFIEPYENWALLFIRNDDSLLAFSTQNQERSRRYGGWNYSLNSLESGLERSETTEQAISRLDDTSLLPLESAASVYVISAIGAIVAEIPSMAASSRFSRGTHGTCKEELEPRIAAYLKELLSEHLGIDMGLQIHSAKDHVAAGRDITSPGNTTYIALKPIKGKSIYSRGQFHMSI
ncbi:MAG: hypothetical protein KGI97_08265, partial [Alphaproteobacteria bacterium]|nr:hypothetical protein [Alphaproteobacteria bacterium]